MDHVTAEACELIDYLVHQFLREGWHLAVRPSCDRRRKGTDMLIDRPEAQRMVSSIVPGTPNRLPDSESKAFLHCHCYAVYSTTTFFRSAHPHGRGGTVSAGGVRNVYSWGVRQNNWWKGFGHYRHPSAEATIGLDTSDSV